MYWMLRSWREGKSYGDNHGPKWMPYLLAGAIIAGVVLPLAVNELFDTDGEQIQSSAPPTPTELFNFNATPTPSDEQRIWGEHFGIEEERLPYLTVVPSPTPEQDMELNIEP